MNALKPPASSGDPLAEGAGLPPFTAEAAAWIRDEVIGSYHWYEWRDDWRLSTPANVRNPECEPTHVGEDEPISARVHFCDQPVCALTGPGFRIGGQRRPRVYAVWLAHARDRYARTAQAEDDAVPDAPPAPAKPAPEPVPVKAVASRSAPARAPIPGQLGLFLEEATDGR